MFSDLKLKQVYTSDDDIATDFYIPVLKNAKSFDRTSAYFSAKSLAKYSEGLEYFANNGNKYRLIVSHEISEQDFNEIKLGYKIKKDILNGMLNQLNQELSIKEEMNISNLAYLIARGTVEIKIAFKREGIFHDKSGILKDEVGNIICFRGSYNETLAASDFNYESLQLSCSWIDSKGFYLDGIKKTQMEFERLWNNKKDNLIILPAENVIIKEIIKHNKGKIIVEEKLLSKEAVILDYEDNRLVLQFNTDSIEWFTNKAFYKMKIKNKVASIRNNVIYFKSELVYPDYIKINELLKKKLKDLGYEYFSTNRLNEYIESRNLYIKSRAKLGIELKTDHRRLEDKIEEFERIVNTQFVRKLRKKQLLDAFFMYAMRKSGNFSVPGSGKTSSALAVYSVLKYKGLVDRVVVIGPKNSFESWINEFNACFGDKQELKCFNIQDSKYKTPAQKKSALIYDTFPCNMFLFNYESIGTYLEEIKHIVENRTLLVFDEVHKAKAIDGIRAVAALEIARFSTYTIAMTGTPIPNSYLDLYNLLHILYNDEYREYFDLDISFLRDPSPTDIEYINEKIQPFFCRTTKQQLNVPEPNADKIRKITVSESEQKLFNILNKKYRNNKLALFIRILQMETNPKLLLNNLDISEFSNILDIDCDIDEIDYVDYSSEVANEIKQIETTSKKDVCINLIKDLVRENKTVIIWCVFVDTIKDLKKRLDNLGIKAECIWGEVLLEDRTKIIESFRNGEFSVLITNPHTLAESVSLHSVCHDAIYYEYTYNLVHLLQSKDRIHRLGLKDDQYTQYYYLQDNYILQTGEEFSMDEEVYNRLKKKEETMLKAIDNSELEPVYTSEEDLNLIFKKLL